MMSIVEVGLHHRLRPTVETHVTDVYRRAFAAEISQYAPRLFAALDSQQSVRCAAGVRFGGERFHSECYLDRPAEQVVSAALSRPVDRLELLEFTTLACARPGDALGFVSAVVQMGREMGCHVALFTATAPLRKLLRRAGLMVMPIAWADRARVGDAQNWGNYYSTDPVVCVAPDSLRVPKALQAPCFNSVRVAAGSDPCVMSFRR
jgi:hypothetical protein